MELGVFHFRRNLFLCCFWFKMIKVWKGGWDAGDFLLRWPKQEGWYAAEGAGFWGTERDIIAQRTQNAHGGCIRTCTWCILSLSYSTVWLNLHGQHIGHSHTHTHSHTVGHLAIGILYFRFLNFWLWPKQLVYIYDRETFRYHFVPVNSHNV